MYLYFLYLCYRFPLLNLLYNHTTECLFFCLYSVVDSRERQETWDESKGGLHATSPYCQKGEYMTRIWFSEQQMIVNIVGKDAQRLSCIEIAVWGWNIITILCTKLYDMLISSLLVDDLELVSLLKAQVTIMVGFITVYGHHKFVCKRNSVNLIQNLIIKMISNMRDIHWGLFLLTDVEIE